MYRGRLIAVMIGLMVAAVLAASTPSRVSAATFTDEFDYNLDSFGS